MSQNKTGQISVEIAIFATVTVVTLAGLAVWSLAGLQHSYRNLNKLAAFEAAEAGIEYYRWHLAHAPADYYDGHGATSTGPYVHNYYDRSGNQIGAYALAITPPAPGTTIVRVRSTGTVVADPSVKKIIEVRLGISSLAKYAVVVASDVRFGQGTEVFGPIHSNGGIRFDGVAHNLVTSALTAYDDPDHSGGNEWAVHTHQPPVDALPPAPLLSRPDVFQAGRTVGMPQVNFAGISQTLSDIRNQATSSGFYASSSAAYGYDINFRTDGKFDLRKVTSVLNPPGGCSNPGQSGWGTWTVNGSTTVGTYNIPANGLIFIEDNVWAHGQIDGKKINLAAGRFPEVAGNYASITVNSNLLYTHYDGSDVMGLTAQGNINIGLRSNDVLRIDGTLIAQNGRVGRYYYGSGCGAAYIRSTITSFGMIASHDRYGFAYTDGTGYQTRNLIYDANLLFNPPPATPLTGDQYTQLSWDEIQ